MNRPTREQVDAAMRREPSWRVAMEVLAAEVLALQGTIEAWDAIVIDAERVQAENAKLREELLTLAQAARQTVLTDLTSYTQRLLEESVARAETLLGCSIRATNEAPEDPPHDRSGVPEGERE